MIKSFKKFNWFSPLFKYVAAWGLMENFKKIISNWFSPFSCLCGSRGFLKKIKKMFLTDFPLRVFFCKKNSSTLNFFSPSICRYSGVCIKKKNTEEKEKKKKTQNRVPPRWPFTGTLRIRNFSKWWTLLLCSIFTLELPFRTSSSPATSKRVPLRDSQLVLQLVPVQGPASTPGTRSRYEFQ